MENIFENLDKETLLGILDDWAKNWLAHDGLWFQAVERATSLEDAIEADREAWKNFTQIEARRIMERHRIEKGGGIPALVQALQLRMYARLNVQEIIEVTDTRCVFRMVNCRVQAARKAKNMDDFPCKPVGIDEYTYFAKTIDDRIETRCIACPPDDHPEEYWCAWEFTIPSEEG
ncbi:MAG TPA: DUF6125 family protein [Candidatus Lokiarchaeia archaeon]|nr:DUF6125 family protein [Candidatus Lokiarchaeia archaeon]